MIQETPAKNTFPGSSMLAAEAKDVNTLLLEEIEDPPAEFVPLTVDQRHWMLATGVLAEGEPIELLDGLLVPRIEEAWIPGPS